MEPLEQPPAVEEGDDTVAAPEEHEPLLEGELEDAPELDEDELEDEHDDE